MRYRWRTRPYHHQVAAVKATVEGLKTNGSFALLMEPRTGKTKVAIDVAAIMHQAGHVERVLVVCPVSVMDVWMREIRAHCPTRFRITLWDKDGRKQTPLPRWGSGVLEWVIINYDAFSAPGAVVGKTSTGVTRRSTSRGGRFDIKKKITAWSPQLMVLDESHRIKTPSARKTTMIRSMTWNIRTDEAKIPYRLILTGTVMTKKKRVFDIYSQWKNFLNRRSPLVYGRTLAEFKEEYAVWTQRNGYPQWLRNKPRAMEHLRSQLHAEAFAVTRAECYDLPAALPVVMHQIELEESGPYYDQMAAEMVALLKSGEVTWAKIPLVQRLRFQQITSGIVKTEPTPAYPEGRLVRIGKEKLRFFEDILVDLIDQEEKVVVGARFHGDIQGIQALCRRLKVPCFELSGRVARAQRTSNIAQFNGHDGCAVFVAQPAAGALGIDLSSAATMIWYSYTSSWVDYTQFTDRVALSPVAVRYIHLVARGTYDELMYESLQQDGDIARAVTESPDRLLRDFKNKSIASRR